MLIKGNGGKKTTIYLLLPLDEDRLCYTDSEADGLKLILAVDPDDFTFPVGELKPLRVQVLRDGEVRALGSPLLAGGGHGRVVQVAAPSQLA